MLERLLVSFGNGGNQKNDPCYDICFAGGWPVLKWHFIRTRILHVETLYFNKSRFYLELSEIPGKHKGFFKSELFLTTSRKSYFGDCLQ